MKNEESVTKSTLNHIGVHLSNEPIVTSSDIHVSNTDIPGVNVNDALKQANKLGVVMESKHLNNIHKSISNSTLSNFGKPCRQCTFGSAFFTKNVSHLSSVISAFSLHPDIIMTEDIINDF